MGAYEDERDGILTDFGLNLAKLRGSKKLSQARFAKRANVHRNEISDLERGKRQPGLLMLLILADAAGVSLDELVVGKPSATGDRRAAEERQDAEARQPRRELPVPRERQPQHRKKTQKPDV